MQPENAIMAEFGSPLSGAINNQPTDIHTFADDTT